MLKGNIQTRRLSILNLPEEESEYRTLSDVAIHDLGLDLICKKLSPREQEQEMIKRVMAKMTANPKVTQYRCDVFSDILKYPDMRNRMMELLDQVDFLRDYGSFKRDYDESAGTWDLLHRLDEIKEYIQCVEAIFECLSGVELYSEGLINLREYVNQLYHENGFAELKKDIANLKAATSNLKSVTVGINLNERFEADGIGLISVNSKHFTKSNIIANFCDVLSKKDNIKDTTEWEENYKFHPVSSDIVQNLNNIERISMLNAAVANPVMTAGIAAVPDGDSTEDIMRYMDKIVNHMLSSTVKKLKDVLSKHVTISIQNITCLIPEFVYYIRWAEYIEMLMEKGMKFCKATVSMEDKNKCMMRARGIYNLKLASVVLENNEEIIANDLDFDEEHRIYILTGANRGGKTTITQAIGLLFVLAQGGIYVPGEVFEFHPVDCIYTHFPADEDKTMDLGRLGEECSRFRELYKESTKNSLLLLNETFSTTSFEEGYYIACDAVKAILAKDVRTIYNTHMHKLAYELGDINKNAVNGKAVSLIVEAEGGKRSYKVKVAPPEGMSYARDIAEKYGVTFELLTEKNK